MDATQRAALDRAERGGYLPALRSIAQGCSVPFWWHGPDANQSARILHNGSVCFINTGHNLLAVTADHVYAQYLADLSSNATVVCQFGSVTIEPAQYLIQRSSELDLATFEMPSVLLAGTGARPHAPPNWPPAAVEVGDVVMFGGFPGALRIESVPSAELPFQAITGVTQNVSSLNISLQADFQNLHWPLHDSAEFNRIVGGMSGGPVFKFFPFPIEHMLLVGFVYQYHQSYELLLARPASCIDKEGRIASVA